MLFAGYLFAVRVVFVYDVRVCHMELAEREHAVISQLIKKDVDQSFVIGCRRCGNGQTAHSPHSACVCIDRHACHPH